MISLLIIMNVFLAFFVPKKK